MENLSKMAENFCGTRNTPRFPSVVFSCSSSRRNSSLGIFPLLFLLHFLVFILILLSFPAASRCESNPQTYMPMPNAGEDNEITDWAKGQPTATTTNTTHRHRQIRHLHRDVEHNIPQQRKRQSRRHAAMEQDNELDENLKRLIMKPKSNNSADDNDDDGDQHPKQAALLQKQQPSDLSRDDDVPQSNQITGETEEEGGDFPDGYWVRIAQAKVLALAVENGTLPRLDEHSEIMKPASCHKDHKECNEFTTKCAEEKAIRILTQLALQHRQPTRENVTLYMRTILKDCGMSMSFYDGSDLERSSISDSRWNLNFPPANTSRPSPVFHCNRHVGQDNVLTNFRMAYMSNDGNGKVIRSLPETLASDLIPRYFVIEMSHGGGRWRLSSLPVQPFWLFRFSTKTDYSYQIRVTAVSPKYVYPPVVSPLVAIYKSSELTISNPRNLHVVKVTMDTSAARPKPYALLRWESGSGHNASCDFDVYYMDDEEYRNTERKKGDDAFWVKLDNLHFEKNYSVHVNEKFGGGKEMNVSTHLYVPSCLEMRHFSFDHCPPPPPFKVRMENVTDDSFWITWNPPMYVNDTNRILHYNVTVDWIYTLSGGAPTPPIPAADRLLLHGGSYHHASSVSIVSTSQSHLFLRHHAPPAQPYNSHRIFSEMIPGNVTSVQLKNTTHLKGQLKISVAALGPAGSSPLTWEYFNYKGVYAGAPNSPSRTSLVNNWTLWNILIFVVALCGVIGLVSLFCFLKHIHDKRQRQKKRDQKFENYEKESLELQQFGERDATKWEIDCCNLDLREGIGKGNFGLVRRAFLNHEGKKMMVAVKTLRDGVDSKEVDKLWEEYDILRNLDPHVHIVGLKGIVTKHVPVPLLVVEYCDGGDLQSHLRKAVKSAGFSGSRRYSPAAVSASVSSSTLSAGSSYSSIVHPPPPPPASATSVRVVTNAAYFMRNEVDSPPLPPPLTISDMLSYSRQVAVGMEYLSSNKIVHRDLAARNILISGKSRILKISDFGLSRDVYEQNWYKRNSKGDIPIKWLPLESILNELYTSKSDVWSYGILLWEIFTYGGNPYPGVDNIKVFGLLKDGYRMPRPDTCPLDLYELMRFCWNDNPNERPDFTGIRLILEDIIERVTHVTYLNLESSTKVRSSTAEGRGGICAAAAAGTYKNCDSGFDEYDESVPSPTTNEPVLPPRNKKTFG